MEAPIKSKSLNQTLYLLALELISNQYMYTEGGHLNDSAIPFDIQLSLIKGKASDLLCFARALRKSDADLLRNTRELGQELESWRVSARSRSTSSTTT